MESSISGTSWPHDVEPACRYPKVVRNWWGQTKMSSRATNTLDVLIGHFRWIGLLTKLVII